MLFEILRFLGPVISKNIQFDSTKTTSNFHLFHPSCYKYFWKIIKPNNISKNSIQTIDSPWLVLLKLSKASLEIDFLAPPPNSSAPRCRSPFLGEFCATGNPKRACFFGLEDVDHPKNVGPEHVIRMTNMLKKNGIWRILGSPREIYGNFTNCLLDSYTKTKGLGRTVLQIADAKSFMGNIYLKCISLLYTLRCKWNP